MTPLGYLYNVWHDASMLFSIWRRLQRPQRVYLDHAAATPLVSVADKAMKRVTREHFANPSAIHQEGVAAREELERARAKLARCLSVRPEGVTFTASGTESNNLALLGVVYARRAAGMDYVDMEVISTKLEHPSVQETLRALEALGVGVHYAPVRADGRIDHNAFKALLSEKTVLVTCAYVNSEVGVIQPVAQLARYAHAAARTHGTDIVVHIDAAQAPYWLACQLNHLQVDLMSLDAGKCGGPKGVGVLVRRHNVELAPIIHGGPQESGLRPATENLVGIVGAVEAIVAAQTSVTKRADRVAALRDQLITELKTIPGVLLNGSVDERVANNVNISIPGFDSEYAAVWLDEARIACSTKSACSGASGGGSAVVMAMTGDAARAQATLRFTLGPNTTSAELKQVVVSLKQFMALMETI